MGRSTEPSVDGEEGGEHMAREEVKARRDGAGKVGQGWIQKGSEHCVLLAPLPHLHAPA